MDHSINARLIANQKYIFGILMNTFGKDVTKYFVAMLAFCDGNIPQIVSSALEEKRPIFDKISVNKDKFNEMPWELGMESFKNY